MCNIGDCNDRSSSFPCFDCHFYRVGISSGIGCDQYDIPFLYIIQISQYSRITAQSFQKRAFCRMLCHRQLTSHNGNYKCETSCTSIEFFTKCMGMTASCNVKRFVCQKAICNQLCRLVKLFLLGFPYLV